MHSDITASQPTHYSLIGAARAREADGWERLWTVYGDYVRYRVRRAGVRTGECEDVTQEVFATVASGLTDFEPHSKVGSFRAWLGTITRSRAIEHLRKLNRTPGQQAAASGVIDAAVAADPDAEDAEELQQIMKLYDRALELAETDFEPQTVEHFRLRVLDGLSSKEVAARTGSTAAAVRMNKSRVLRRLRELLGDEGG